MLGRTHMAIGAIGAVAATPIVLHSSWQPMRQLLGENWNIIPHVMVAQVVLVAATIAGSLIPDLDQRDSLMAQKVETIGILPVIAMPAAVVVMLHKQTSIIAWALVLFLGVLFSAARNTTRVVGLGIIGAGVLYLGWVKDIPLVAAGLLAAWIIGAMFTKHRTFTHSLLGLALFAVGVHMSVHGLNKVHLGLAETGLILGYALHMVADVIAGGVPLFWPWEKRQGIRLVTTGSPWDHMIGGLAIIGFAALAVL